MYSKTIMAENIKDVGFEEGISWLPAHIVDEACHYHQHNPNPTRPNLNYSGCNSIVKSQKTRTTAAAAAGGPGMQAIFLYSGRSCSSGTGVFLPHRPRTHFQHTSNKHVRQPPPVLLPDRVVQALNLNMHQLGMQLKPCGDNVKNMKGRHNRDGNIGSKKKASDSHSPEIFLPKEWTY